MMKNCRPRYTSYRYYIMNGVEPYEKPAVCRSVSIAKHYKFYANEQTEGRAIQSCSKSRSQIQKKSRTASHN